MVLRLAERLFGSILFLAAVVVFWTIVFYVIYVVLTTVRGF